MSPDHQTVNPTDHVMVGKGKIRLIHNVRSKRDYNCNSEHFLVPIKIKQTLITPKKLTSTKTQVG
jgi:hypothetical protein